MNMRMMRGFGGGWRLGSVTFTIETKRANLPAVLEILRQILREPTLPASEFEVMKNEQIAGIEQGRSDPMRQGLNHIQRLLSHYPSDDVRYVPTIDEQIERLKKAQLDQVQPLYRDYLGADHGELVVVGDFEPSEILPILAKTFDGWKAEKPYARIERPYQPDIKPQRETVSTPDKENAVYLAGLSMPIKDDDPDYPALLVGQLHPGRRRPLVPHRRSPSPEGRALYTAMSMFAASPLDPRADLMILAIYNPDNVDKVVTGVDEELTACSATASRPPSSTRPRPATSSSSRSMRTIDAMLAAIARGKPLSRPDHAVPGRPRAKDQGTDARGRRTPRSASTSTPSGFRSSRRAISRRKPARAPGSEGSVDHLLG